jgi:hypothetical protein
MYALRSTDVPDVAATASPASSKIERAAERCRLTVRAVRLEPPEAVACSYTAKKGAGAVEAPESRRMPRSSPVASKART